jgi:protein-tyrosine phosphatase
MGLIDLHCHLLPGVDDGALDLPDSLAMARRAVAQGFEAICATPHIRSDHDVVLDELPGRVAALQDELAARDVPLRVLIGGEVSELAVARLSAAELRALALNRGRWVLLEPKAGPLSDTLDVAVAQLEEHGLHALIAHPERHLGEDLFERLAGLVARGALVQATAAFFTREDTAPGMRMLAERGLVHVLGSDAHSSHGGREIAFAGALEALAGVEHVSLHLDWIADAAPRAILAGERPPLPYAAG